MSSEWPKPIEVPQTKGINFCQVEIGDKLLLGYIEKRDNQVYGLMIPLSTSNAEMFMKGPSYDGSNEKIFADNIKLSALFNSRQLDTNFDISKAYKKIGISEEDRQRSQIVMSVSLSNGIALYLRHPLTSQISETQDFVKVLQDIPCRITPVNFNELTVIDSFSHSLSL